MKTLTLTFAFLLSAILAFGQVDDESGIKMISDYSSDNSEIRDILSFEKIDYYKLKFVGSKLIGKDYSLIVKEIWNGEIKKTDTLVNTAKHERMEKLSFDTLNLKVIAKKTPDDKLKMNFRFSRFGIERKFDAIDSDDYSLRDIGTKMEIEPGKEFYALAYILPYEKDGWKMYCAVDSSGKDVESWGKEFAIEHYLVFEMKFE